MERTGKENGKRRDKGEVEKEQEQERTRVKSEEGARHT